MKRLLLFIPIFAMVMAACAPLAVPESTQTSPTSTPLPPTSTPIPSPTPLPVDLTPAQRAALNALMEALNLPADQITFISTEAVEWPDGCLGLHRIDVMCTMATVPGFRIILEANGQQYVYHTNQDGSVAAAALDSAVAPTRAALQALAKALGIDMQSITLVSVEPKEWPDACLGVAQPGLACAQIITPGWLIVLEANGLRYEYHTNADGSAALPATLALTWKREGGLAGFCDELAVYLSGEFVAYSCKGVNPVTQQLTAEELEQLQAWAKQFGSATISQSDPTAVADGMSITVTFNGVGSEQLTSADEQALSDWAQAVYARLTK